MHEVSGAYTQVRMYRIVLLISVGIAHPIEICFTHFLLNAYPAQYYLDISPNLEYFPIEP